ncbi:MAG: A24 family peptidase [Chloroflexi bacterium]|nr:A24 family peptidase [Chloroflexota bacterium]
MIVAGAFVAAVLGWLAGLGLNRLAAWLPARDDNAADEDRPRIGADGHEIFPLSAFIRVHPWLTGRRGRPTRQRELALSGATALLAVALWLRYGASWPLLPAGIAGLLLLLIAAIDIDRRLVLNEVLLAGAVLAALYAALGGWGRLLSALVGCGVGLGLFLLIALLSRPIVKSSGGMGAGDVKLAGLLGLMFGYPAVMPVLFLGVLAGGLTSAALLLARRLERKAMIPYAPFLAVGGIVALLLG